MKTDTIALHPYSQTLRRTLRPSHLAAALLGLSTLALAWDAQAQTYTASNTTAGTFDQTSDSRTFDFAAFTIPADSTIGDVNLTIQFSKTPDADFPPFFSEITFLLIAPGGATSVALIDGTTFDDGDINASFTGAITFDDAAAQAVNFNRDQPSAGTFRPIESLTEFNGLAFASTGAFTLFIEDSNAGSPLTFTSASLSVTAVPEPATIGLVFTGALLGGIVTLRRRRASN